MPAHCLVVDFPIEPRHVPNLFVQGTLIRDGQVHTETCELFMPPVADLLRVELRADKETYRPGEQGHVRVKVSDASGKPVTGDVNLTAYDKAVTYIHDKSPHGPRSLVTERLTKYWSSHVGASLGPRLFDVSGTFVCPEYHLSDDFDTGVSIGGAAPTGGDPSDAGGLGGESAGGRSQREPRLEQQTAAESGIDLVQPEVRQRFTDTALWLASLPLDEAGTAETDIVFPESLTTWRLRGCVITTDTLVGSATVHVTTSKNLLVRLQSPRFVVERDKIVLSAIVDNYLHDDKEVKAELVVPAARFRPTAAQDAAVVPDAEGNLHLVAQATIKSGAERRFDWPLEALADGPATITVRARSDVMSDAMSVTIPVRERGEWQTVARTGSFRIGEVSEKTVEFELPEDVALARTQIDVTLAPSPAVAAFDALPFLADYPYGCTEQTMSRFYPTVLPAHTQKRTLIWSQLPRDSAR